MSCLTYFVRLSLAQLCYLGSAGWKKWNLVDLSLEQQKADPFRLCSSVRSSVLPSVRSKVLTNFLCTCLRSSDSKKTFEQIKGSWRRESKSKSWTSSLMYLPTYQAYCWPREQEYKIWRELLQTVGGSHHGLAVMGGDSWSECCGFESQHRIFFS